MLLKGKERIPTPDSQKNCIVAAALARLSENVYIDVNNDANNDASNNNTPSSIMTLTKIKDKARDSFDLAMKRGVPADGRFLNAILRCYGSDIQGAIAAWKGSIGAASRAYGSKSKGLSKI
jgi:hypothetical protein